MTSVFSGMQPSGELHIGNYLGALKTWVQLQERYPCIFCVVDLHALTQPFEPREMPGRIRDMVIGWLSAGLDPDRCTMFVQSTVAEHAELAWVLNTITPMGLLERMTQFKDKSKRQPENINVGLFDYPVLQAADIVVYRADGVPVGEDQVQHVEFTRDVVGKFNYRFGETFPMPRARLSQAPRVMGLDGERKMSKSLGNQIGLNDSPEEVWNKIAPAKTDIRRKRRTDPGVPEECNIFSYHRFFSSSEQQAWAAEGCRTAGIGCRECKRLVADNINAVLAPMRERRAAIERRPRLVDETLAAGTAKLRPLARETMELVRERLGLPTAERYQPSACRSRSTDPTASSPPSPSGGTGR
ncbi:MAG: tryptophan--tRNA ligase [Acidobacteriota bacterium]|nr:MAG: tryptophan--tRNA ligase [Acidobacteriota bacterium]